MVARVVPKKKAQRMQNESNNMQYKGNSSARGNFHLRGRGNDARLTQLRFHKTKINRTSQEIERVTRVSLCHS